MIVFSRGKSIKYHVLFYYKLQLLSSLL